MPPPSSAETADEEKYTVKRHVDVEFKVSASEATKHSFKLDQKASITTFNETDDLHIHNECDFDGSFEKLAEVVESFTKFLVRNIGKH